MVTAQSFDQRFARSRNLHFSAVQVAGDKVEVFKVSYVNTALPGKTAPGTDEAAELVKGTTSRRPDGYVYVGTHSEGDGISSDIYVSAEYVQRNGLIVGDALAYVLKDAMTIPAPAEQAPESEDE